MRQNHTVDCWSRPTKWTNPLWPKYTLTNIKLTLCQPEQLTARTACVQFSLPICYCRLYTAVKRCVISSATNYIEWSNVVTISLVCRQSTNRTMTTNFSHGVENAIFIQCFDTAGYSDRQEGHPACKNFALYCYHSNTDSCISQFSPPLSLSLSLIFC